MNRASIVRTLILFIALTTIVLLVPVLRSESARAALQPPSVLTPTPTVGALELLQFEPPYADADDSQETSAGGVTDVQDAPGSTSTVRVTTHITSSADAEILQGYPTANCGGKAVLEMRAGYDAYQNPDGRVVRSLVHFYLPDIPGGATVQDAALELFVTGAYDVPGQSMIATPFRVSSPWYENAVTWSTQPAWAEGYDATPIAYAAGWVDFDVTGLVQGWVNGTYANHGIVIRGREASPGWRAFGTRNAWTGSSSNPVWLAPRLALTYSFEPDFRMFLVANRHTLRSGDSVSSVVYLDGLGGFDENVDLAVEGLPPHSSYALDNAGISPPGATLLRITTTPSIPAGTHPFTLRGTSASKIHTVQGTLHVIQPDFALQVSPITRTVSLADETALTVYLTSTEGFDRGVALAVGGLPSQAGYTWSQNPVTPTASVLLTVTTGADIPTGVYACAVTGTASSLVHSAPFTLTVIDPTFEISLSQARQRVSPGDSTRYNVSISRVGQFSGSVSMQVGGLPAGTTHQWSQDPVTPPAEITLTVDTSLHVPLGEYNFFITGTSELKTSAVSATLDVIPHAIHLPLVLRDHDRASPAVGREADGTVPSIALLVGVARYQEPGTVTSDDERVEGKPINLMYSTADAPAIQGELRRTSFASENVKLLLDSQATKGAIHDAIVNWIDPLEDEHTVVVLSFSGHGLYAPDDDGDEDDPYDEFIVPYGIDVTVDEPRLDLAIRDDELAAWLDELESQKTVVLIDTCFSGGLVPSAAAGTVKSLSTYLGRPATLSAQDWQNGFAQDIGEAGRVIMMASAEDETSIESAALGHGVFTYYLIEALRSASADTNGNGWVSAEEAYVYLRPKVRDFVHPYVQNPQISDGVTGEVDLTPPLTSVASCPDW